jgi:hypothetical protein
MKDAGKSLTIFHPSKIPFPLLSRFLCVLRSILFSSSTRCSNCWIDIPGRTGRKQGKQWMEKNQTWVFLATQPGSDVGQVPTMPMLQIGPLISNGPRHHLAFNPTYAAYQFQRPTPTMLVAGLRQGGARTDRNQVSNGASRNLCELQWDPLLS